MNVLKGKVNYHSIMDTVVISALTRQIREFLASSDLSCRPSTSINPTNEMKYADFLKTNCLF